MKQNIVLHGKEVYAQIVMIDSEPLLDKNDVPYKRYAYQAVAFILREPAYKCFDSGDMAGLTLTPTTREEELIDPDTKMGTGQWATREGWTYGGHLTQAQDLKIEIADARIAAARKGITERIFQSNDLTVAAAYDSDQPQVAGYPLTANHPTGHTGATVKKQTGVEPNLGQNA